MELYLQEFFTCANPPEELTKRLISSGFQGTQPKGTFKTADAFLSLRDVTRPDGIGSESKHDYGFVLDLYRPLIELGDGHPVRRFFRKLDRPFAHGMYGEAAHCINEYTL